jgi:hypothetical protein
VTCAEHLDDTYGKIRIRRKYGLSGIQAFSTQSALSKHQLALRPFPVCLQELAFTIAMAICTAIKFLVRCHSESSHPRR